MVKVCVFFRKNMKPVKQLLCCILKILARKTIKFSDIFKGYRNVTLERKELRMQRGSKFEPNLTASKRKLFKYDPSRFIPAQS